MPIVAVYVDRSKCYTLFNLLRTLQKFHSGEIILDLTDQIETKMYVLKADGKRPFFKCKQDNNV